MLSFRKMKPGAILAAATLPFAALVLTVSAEGRVEASDAALMAIPDSVVGLQASESVTDAVSVVADEAPTFTLIGTGVASYYGARFAGNRTASGERFDPSDLTAAHRTLPFGSMVRVTNTRTGASVVVRINDRGPFHGNRVIDLSKAAAREIGLITRGRGEVRLALLDS